MWIEVRRLCNAVEDFTRFDEEDAVNELLDQLEKQKWRIQNILKNPAKSASDRANLKPNTDVKIDGATVVLDENLISEAIIISDIFNMNEMDALDLVLSGESQKLTMDGLNRGLIAVVCYYDVHRLLAVLLRRILLWDRELINHKLKNFIEYNFIQRSLFQRFLNIQSTFNVGSEFHTLMQPHVNGLGGSKHQQLLRGVIDEIREMISECIYAMCDWGSDKNKDFANDLYPVVKKCPMGEKMSSLNLTAWMALVKLTSSTVLNQSNCVSSILEDLVKEIRDETAWADQSVCGTLQLACAVAIKSISVSPANHLSIANMDINVDLVVDRAVRNLSFQFIRHGIIESDSFKLCASHIQILDVLLKQFIIYFPAKLFEVEHNSEDELTWADEMMEKGQHVSPSFHYENFIRCIADLYCIADHPKTSIKTKELIVDLSLAYSSLGSMELCRFLERAREPHHVMTAVAYLDLLKAICRNRATAAFVFDMFARIAANNEGYFGWDQLMTALRSYEKLFRNHQPVVSHFGTQPISPQTQPIISPRELAGLIGYINLARTVAEQEEEAAASFMEERQWAVVEASVGVVSAPVPLPLKGALLRFLSTLVIKDSAALRVWNSLQSYQICWFAENGALLGLQQELEERECVQKQYDTSLGFAHLMKALLSRNILPDFSPPYLQYLTKSIFSQLATRSYDDVFQMWELAEVSMTAMINLISQSHTDGRSVAKKEAHIALLIQLLNDTPVYRALCAVLLEDCESHLDPCSSGSRPSERAALVALRLLSLAISRHGPLRSAVRSADCDMMTASISSLLLNPLNHSGTSLLDIIFQYLDQVDDLPCHALPAARLLRELAATRPSLQKKMVELMRSRRNISRNIRAIRSVLNHTFVTYSIQDVIEKDLDEDDVGRVRGETARIVLETLADGLESDPSGWNLCYLLFAFEMNRSGQLYENDMGPTGFHQVVFILERFIDSKEPLNLHCSALLEPCFRLMQRLVSVDCIYSSAVLRYLRPTSLIHRLLSSPFITTSLSMDAAEIGTEHSLTRMISGCVLHLTALEISSLLTTGHYDVPHQMYRTLLEASRELTARTDADPEVDNLLFSLLRHGHMVLHEEVIYPHLVHFNSEKLFTLFEGCKTVTVFNIAQYDIEYLNSLLKREITATQADDTSIATQELEAVLTYCTDLNSELLHRGASEQLVSGCTALLNVFALFAPVPFFSIESQLDVLTDAVFLLIEFTSGCTPDAQTAICSTTLRLCRAICSMTKQHYNKMSEVRLCLSRLVTPLLELLIQPGERPLAAKISLYDSIRICVRTCYEPIEKDEECLELDEWLSKGRLDGRQVDALRDTFSQLSSEMSQCLTRDIVDLSLEHKITPLLLLSDLLYEDFKAAKKISSHISKTGITRYLTELLSSLSIDWNLLSRNEVTNVSLHSLFTSIMLVLTRLSMSECGWTTLAELAVPEVFSQLKMFSSPPKQVFLEPATINQNGTASSLFASSFSQILSICMSLCSKPRWKKLSLKIVDVIQSESELFNQLMRADIDCSLLDISSTIIKEISNTDDAVQEVIDNDSVLRQLRQRGTVSQKEEKMPLGCSFNAPSRLLKSMIVS